MRLVALFLVGLALSTVACNQMADEARQMLSLDSDQASVEVNDDSVSVETRSDTDRSPSPAARPSVVAPGVRVKGDRVTVHNDGTEGSNPKAADSEVDVKTNRDSVEVRTGGDKTRVEVGGVKVDGNKVTVPGVGTVSGY